MSVPFISAIRSTGLEEINTLDLGPLLTKVRTHVKKLINSLDIILSTDSSSLEAILDGNEKWNRTDTIDAIKNLIARGQLPKLRELFTAFLIGALATWERFSSEFSEDGKIAGLTAS